MQEKWHSSRMTSQLNQRSDKIKENAGKAPSGKIERLSMLSELPGIKYRILSGHCSLSIMSRFCYECAKWFISCQWKVDVL